MPCGRDASPASPGTRRRPLAVALLVALAATASFPALPAPLPADPAAPATRYRGRPLAEALEELRARGLNLIFSSAVVTGELRVTVEPAAAEPRAVLDEILAPLGLAAREGPGGSILVVKAPAPRALPADAGVVRGRVVSSVLGAPVGGATVRIAGGSARATTRPDGTFELPRVAAGTHEVVIDAPGFPAPRPIRVRVPAEAPVELTVTLDGHPTFAEELLVTPGRLSIVREEQVSPLDVGDADAVLVPAIGGDVSRVVELLPGVAAADHSAAFHVRGSRERDVSLVLDGLELYEPFHLQSFQSPFSLVDGALVESIDFYGGGLTADFGDRHGGLVEMSTWAPREPHATRLEIGSLNSSLTYGTRTRGGASLFSVRAWYPEALRDTMELGEDGLDPRFADAYAKHSFELESGTLLSAHGLLADDRVELAEPGGESVDYRSRNGYLWLRALRSWPSAAHSETVLSAGRLDRSRKGTSAPEDEVIAVSDRRTVEIVGLEQDATWELSGSHLLRGGFEVRHLAAEYRYAAGTGARRLSPSGSSAGVYLAHRSSLTPELAAELGVRWDRQSHTDGDQWSPRLNAVWRPDDRSEVRLGVGGYYQSQRIHELPIEDGATEFFPPELSRQAELTYQRELPARLRLRLDAYYRRLSRLHPRWENLFNPVELFPETEADRVLLRASRARLKGAEVLLRADPSRPLHGWASYVWSSAYDVIDGVLVPRSWDQTHAVKWLAGYRPGQRWSFSLAGVWHTGWPTTPVTAELTALPDGSTRITRVQGPLNSDRFPDYGRLDAKLSRVFAVPGGRLRLDLEVVNLTDRDNACCVDELHFEPRADGTVDVSRELDHWLGITPSVSLLWEL